MSLKSLVKTAVKFAPIVIPIVQKALKAKKNVKK
ncbi:hypothetical protein C7437_10749 [Psychrobacillus insolitus]|jgi:hypothetical protein|uniref:Uncharacterized protein n=1 Tax=Psychrobacillus insolitus TaxID=1461 RepID=A0A2W7MEA5_9BACI|nr:hypothetical protein C7437_10749 [Psychrobacillus insolitus]